MRKLAMFFGFLALMFLTTAVAQAGVCSPGDIAGIWKVYGHMETMTSETSSMGIGLRMTWVFDSNGHIIEAKPMVSMGQIFGTVFDGQVALASNCRITGQILTNFGPLPIEHAFMDTGKSTIAGLMSDPSGTCHFNAVRK